MAESETQKAAEVRRRLTAEHRKNLYEATRVLDLDTRCRIGLRVLCPIYMQDPFPTGVDPKLGLQEVDVRWEPSLGDGPTNARFAVVDYDGDLGVLRPPARWGAQDVRVPRRKRPAGRWRDGLTFPPVHAGQRLGDGAAGPRVLRGPALARPAESVGVRRQPASHRAAGRLPGRNAFYDRHSKSLKLYYFGDPLEPRHTCLSHDIISHEMGHAILDGIRPCFLENSSWETAAFHEFIGDLTAILDGPPQQRGARESPRTCTSASSWSTPGVPGRKRSWRRSSEPTLENRPFLRSALNRTTFGEARELRSAHRCSQVLSGAMFDILAGIARQYLAPERQAEREKTGHLQPGPLVGRRAHGPHGVAACSTCFRRWTCASSTTPVPCCATTSSTIRRTSTVTGI